MLTLNVRIKEEIEMVENKSEVDVFYFPGTIDFKEIDGTIDFIMTIMNYILKYGKRNSETNSYLRKIRGILSKIDAETVNYNEDEGLMR